VKQFWQHRHAPDDGCNTAKTYSDREVGQDNTKVAFEVEIYICIYTQINTAMQQDA
jgi:hypothetical protein